MNKINLRQVIFFLVGITGVAIMAALQMKLDIGIGPWDGMNMIVSLASSIKVGDVSIIIAATCVFLQFLVLRRDFKPFNLLSLFLAFFMGKLINFFYYNIFELIDINSYYIKLIIFTLSIVVIGFFVSIIQTANFINLPLEGLCQAIAPKTRFTFAQIRQICDVLFVIVILAITFVYKVPITLREGSIISLFLFGPSLGFFEKYLIRFAQKYDIVAD